MKSVLRLLLFITCQAVVFNTIAADTIADENLVQQALKTSATIRSSEASYDRIVFGVHSKTAPLEWRANGIDQGFNVELMNRIGQILDKPIMVRRKTFQQLIEDVEDPSSDIDVIAVVSPIGISRNLSQSDPIYATHAKAYTRQGAPFIETWSDLDGKRVAIKHGALVDVFLEKQPQNFTPVTVDLYETGFQLLGEDLVDVVLAENFVARRLQPKYPLVRSSSNPLIFGAFSFVSHPSKQAMMRDINDALRQLKLSGEYDRLVRKWFGTGREKVDITTTEQKMLALAIVVALISVIGALYTAYVSRNLRVRSEALALELKQRKIAEKQISSLSQQFQNVLDGIPHCVTILNRQMDCLWSNDAEQLLHKDEFEYLDGMPFALEQSVKQVLDTQGSFIADMRYNSQFWQVQIHPIANEQAVVLVQENTEQHVLRQANDEASRLASLGELSAGIAHEINNPTGIIIHSVALFMDAIKDLQAAADSYQNQNPFWLVAGLEPEQAFEELHHSAQAVDDSAKRISRIVNDLKRYALPHEDSHHQAVSINEVVEVALRLTANQVKRLQVSVELQQPEPIITGDAQQLHQVLINLIQNACHACDSSADTISIVTQQDADKVYVMVNDTGSGMDNATLARITEPFFTTRRSYGGSGLGLSVCSRILKEHGANMLVQSALGQGSRFTLTFDRLNPSSSLASDPTPIHKEQSRL
ncbi:transporter substrate-binding domain-containing protein [Shewanella maritima]|uniref:histidine kinase n=1 Tax=Shewanella maritima TaxID=2520507 RepID=A0A411PIK4_9GAMM|nr:transporter substrate-binding domain-containing protein [Shewanella maritima]QBF83304.1 transporter substrate-binding domain-containing protein [Shewanella maritima]